MSFKESVKEWLGLDKLEERLNSFEHPEEKVYHFWGENPDGEIHLYVGDEDITGELQQIEGAYKDGLFIFVIQLGAWNESRQGRLHIVLPEVLQEKVKFGFNNFALGNAFITSGGKVNGYFRIPAQVWLANAFNNLYCLELVAPASEYEPYDAFGGQYQDALWKVVSVRSDRKDIPCNFHYLQEGGLIFGSIKLIEIE